MLCILWFFAYCLLVVLLYQTGWIFLAGFFCGAGWLFWQRVAVRILDIIEENKERKNGT